MFLKKQFVLFLGFLFGVGNSHAQMGDPLYCTDSTDSATQSATWYLTRYYNEEISPDVPPSLDMIRVDLDANTGTWSETLLYSTPLATVAAGLGKGSSHDGYAYGLRAVGPWNRVGDVKHTLIRYGSTGAELVHGDVPVAGLSKENLNAADLNPVDPNELIAGQLRDGYSLDRLYKINISANTSTVLMLTPTITGISSGDLVVDPTGRYAYGIAYERVSTFVSRNWFWRADLTTGAVIQKEIDTMFLLEPPYGGAVWLADDTIAFYFNGSVVSGIPITSQMITVDPSFLEDGSVTIGSTITRQAMTGSDSSDAFSCFPKDSTTPPAEVGDVNAIPSIGAITLFLLSVILGAWVSIRVRKV